MSNTKFVSLNENYDSVGFKGVRDIFTIKGNGSNELITIEDSTDDCAIYILKEDIDLLILALQEFKRLDL